MTSQNILQKITNVEPVPINKYNMSTHNSTIINVLDYIGYYAPLIAICLVSYFLWKQPKFLFIYVVGVFINSQLNSLAKMIIKQPRPPNQKYNEIDNDSFTTNHIYGMPSLHAQMVAYSLTFGYLVSKSTVELISGSFVLAITIYQRWKYHRHSLEQLAVGAVLGSAFAYGVFYLVTEKAW